MVVYRAESRITCCIAIARLSPTPQPGSDNMAMAASTGITRKEAREGLGRSRGAGHGISMDEEFFFANVQVFWFRQRKTGSAGFEIDLVHFVLTHKVLVNVVQDSVHELAALRGTVILCQVDVFIDGYLRRNGLEIEEFRHAHLHQDHVESGDPFRIPVL